SRRARQARAPAGPRRPRPRAIREAGSRRAAPGLQQDPARATRVVPPPAAARFELGRLARAIFLAPPSRRPRTAATAHAIRGAAGPSRTSRRNADHLWPSSLLE